jgi:hypothetical protein
MCNCASHGSSRSAPAQMSSPPTPAHILTPKPLASSRRHWLRLLTKSTAQRPTPAEQGIRTEDLRIKSRYVRRDWRCCNASLRSNRAAKTLALSGRNGRQRSNRGSNGRLPFSPSRPASVDAVWTPVAARCARRAFTLRTRLRRCCCQDRRCHSR